MLYSFCAKIRFEFMKIINQVYRTVSTFKYDMF